MLWRRVSDCLLAGLFDSGKTVQVETNVYSVTSPDGELIWTGTSNTFDPASARQVINGLVDLVVKELEKLEILPKSGK